MNSSDNQNIPDFQGSMKTIEKNHLEIGGVDTIFLAEKYKSCILYDL